jgi:FkbM family methyltransferase
MSAVDYRPVSSSAELEAQVTTTGWSLFKRKAYREALALASLAATATNRPDTLRLVAACRAKLGEPEEGLPYAARAISLDPKNSASLALLEKLTTQLQAKIRKLSKRRQFLRDSIGEVMEFARLHGFRPGTIIDIGVATGTPGLYESFPDAFLILVDPVSENEAFMHDIASKRERAKAWLAAAGPRPGRDVLSVDPSFSGSRLADVVGRHKKGVDREVDVVTIDDLVREAGCSGPFVIKVDTEGAELSVLEGAIETLRHTEMLILESRTWPIARAPQLLETLVQLQEWGFVAFDIIDRNYHDVAGYLKQFDLVAVREDGYFRSPETYAASAPKASDRVYEEIVSAKLRKREALLERIGHTGGTTN